MNFEKWELFSGSPGINFSPTTSVGLFHLDLPTPLQNVQELNSDICEIFAYASCLVIGVVPLINRNVNIEGSTNLVRMTLFSLDKTNYQRDGILLK